MPVSEAGSHAGAGRPAGRVDPGRQGKLWTWVPHSGELVRPLWPHEYLNSVLDQDVSLHSRRLSWETQLHFDHPTYVTTHYKQVSCHPWPPPSPGQQLASEPLPG